MHQKCKKSVIFVSDMIKFGLIGYPLGHSFSRKYFGEKFAKEGIDAEYINFEIPDALMLDDVVSSNPELQGLNCTIPHKQAIMPLMDELDPVAREIGAVNVIKIVRSNTEGSKGYRLIGHNSDIIGFTDSIRPLLHSHHTRALVLGTGGASRAICVALRHLGIEWKYVSRTPREGQYTYSDLHEHPEIMDEYTIIVNCSPLGMFPKNDTCPDLPYERLTERHLLYDLIYNPETTLFMQKGMEHSATVKNGMEMLILQAIASWEIWNS